MWPFVRSTSAPEDVPAILSEIPQEVQLANDTDSEPEVPLGLTGHPNERLSIPFVLRAPILMLTSFSTGFFLGSAVGASKASFRYRAENAHRMPTTSGGWFLYQKSKNYHAIIGGVKEGVKMGGVLTGWATLFMGTEEIIDQARAGLFARGDDGAAHGQRDVASTVVAALSTAGMYSWKRGLDKFTAARTAKTALKGSIIFGLAQDATATIRGDRPAYIDWIGRKVFGSRSTIDAA